MKTFSGHKLKFKYLEETAFAADVVGIIDFQDNVKQAQHCSEISKHSYLIGCN